MTISAFIIMMQIKKWKLSFHSLNHSKFGIAFLGLTLSMIIGGVFAWYNRSLTKPFGTKAMMRFKKVHMYFAYFVFIFVQMAVCSGILAK